MNLHFNISEPNTEIFPLDKQIILFLFQYDVQVNYKSFLEDYHQNTKIKARKVSKFFDL